MSNKNNQWTNETRVMVLIFLITLAMSLISLVENIGYECFIGTREVPAWTKVSSLQDCHKICEVMGKEFTGERKNGGCS